MAPKRLTKATTKIPGKNAKVGAVLSGISRAAPGAVRIGSMVPSVDLLGSHVYFDEEDPIEDAGIDSFQPALVVHKVGSTTAPARPATSAAAASQSTITPVNLGMYCHFCCDGCGPPRKHECVECGAIVCEQYVLRSSGCICINTVEASAKTFLCPVCSRTAESSKNKPLGYMFVGFGRRAKAKLAWPMVIVNLTLESMKDDYLAASITLEAENHYQSHPENVSVAVFSLSCDTDEANDY
jgi:hypothetical protein